jgi:subtilisin family serine protease
MAVLCGLIGQSQSRGEDQLLSAQLRNQRSVVAGTPSNLSPSLIATRDGGGILKGSDILGNSVIAVPHANVKRFKASLSVRRLLFGGTVTPANYLPVKRLKLSYQSDSRPTDQDLQGLGLRVIEDYKKGSFLIVEPLNNNIDAELAGKLEKAKISYAAPLLRLRAIPPSKLVGIRAARPANLTTAASTPTNDPGWTSLCSIGDGLWGMKNIHVPAAWKKVQESKVVVAVIDTGVDYTHEDLKDNMWSDPNGKHGFDFVENDDDPMDQNSHGTHCAGTIGAKGNNHIGVVGVNWKVQIMAVRWLDASGIPGPDGLADAIKAIDWAVDHGAKVLSNSWFWPEDDPDLEAAIKRANDGKVLFLAGAGNFAQHWDNNKGDNDNPTTSGRYPSSYPLVNIISVAAIDASDNLAEFSEWGKKTVHLGAPGVDILSTVPHNDYDCTFSGTSMAAPHVAGAAALTMARFPNASYTEIKDYLLMNARKINALKDRCVTGGTLDVSFLGQ